MFVLWLICLNFKFFIVKLSRFILFIILKYMLFKLLDLVMFDKVFIFVLWWMIYGFDLELDLLVNFIMFVYNDEFDLIILFLCCVKVLICG